MNHFTWSMHKLRTWGLRKVKWFAWICTVCRHLWICLRSTLPRVTSLSQFHVFLLLIRKHKGWLSSSVFQGVVGWWELLPKFQIPQCCLKSSRWYRPWAPARGLVTQWGRLWGLWQGLISCSAPSREDDSFLRRTAAISRRSMPGTWLQKSHSFIRMMVTSKLKEYRIEERYAGSGDSGTFLEWKEQGKLGITGPNSWQ